MSLPVRAELRGLEPYGAPQLDVPVLLNVNENPYPLPDDVVAAIVDQVRSAATSLNRYPDREFMAVRRALVDYLARESGVRLDPERIWAANGSNEVMLHLFSAFGGHGHTALTFTPSYSMYPEYARDTGTGWVTVARAADFTIDMDTARSALATHRPALIVIASPNNPTGTATRFDEVRALCEATRGSGPGGSDTVLVIDEAYGEFRRAGVPSALELLAEFSHLVVSRTMSKAFGYAGARIGYAAASTEIIDAIRIVRLPYHLSAVTQAVALAGLAHADALQAQVATLREERDRTVARLRADGWTVVDSDANFVLFGTFTDRHAAWQQLLDQGVLIRETGPEGFLRVSIGTSAEMDAFFDALGKVGR